MEAAAIVGVEINTFREAGQPVEIPAGISESWQAFALFSDGSFTDITTTAVWDSSNNTIATVLAGNVDAISAGGTGISISYTVSGGSEFRELFGDETFTDEVTLTVTSAELLSIDVSPDSATVAPCLCN